jgi:NitT/TauT family transport system permease protein/taurine transport system permease protein
MSAIFSNLSPTVTRTAWAQSAVSLLLLLGLWILATTVLGVPSFTLPSPAEVGRAWWDAAAGGGLVSDILISATRLLLGALAGISTGIVLGTLVGLSGTVRLSLEPLVNAMSGIAGIAWIPLALAWFGTGLAMSTFVIWNGMFFVVFANTALGVARVQPSLAQSVRTMGGGRWEVLRTVIFPGAMPDMLTGVRVGLSFAWRSLIAAELLGAPQGLGQWINQAALNQRSDRILAGCITVAVLGVLLERVTVSLIASRTVVKWGTITDAAGRDGR